MTRRPTGTVRTSTTGERDLLLTRTLPMSADDLWAAITESDRLGRWYGTYEGATGVGREVQVTMTAEEGAPTEPAHILECEAPVRLALRLGSAEPGWVVTLAIEGAGDTATLTFGQALAEGIDPADVGPGWEFYLDRLAAAEAGQPLPDWDDTYLELADHYRSAG